MPLGKPRNHGCRISDAWRLDEMRTLILENELLRVLVLVDKGSDIVEFRYKPQDLDFLYFAPGGIRNPRGTPPRRIRRPLFWIILAAAGTKSCQTAALTSIIKGPSWASTERSASSPGNIPF